MKVALIGATGFVGGAILKELVSRGINVLAIARNVDQLTASGSTFEKKSVDAFDSETMSSAIAGADVVVSAYNSGWQNPNIYDDFLKGSAAIQEAVKKAGIERYIVIGGAGSLQIDGHQLVDGPDFPAEYKVAASAARDYLTILRNETELDWAFFSPAIEMHQGITSGRSGKYRLGTTSPVFDSEGRSVLSVEDLAVVIADELEKHSVHKAQFTAAY